MTAPVPSREWPRFENVLLDACGAAGWALVEPRVRRVHLKQSHSLAIEIPAFETVFPQTCVLSLMGTTTDGATLDVAKIGAEGFATSPAARGTSFEIFVRRSGMALSIDTEVVRRAQSASPQFRKAISDYNTAFAYEIAETAICSAVHSIRERCIRSLLVMNDRVRGPIQLSHEVLARMIGVRRASISIVMHELQLSRAIRYRRGNIEIVDRDALARSACSCYQASTSQMLSLKGHDS